MYAVLVHAVVLLLAGLNLSLLPSGGPSGGPEAKTVPVTLDYSKAQQRQAAVAEEARKQRVAEEQRKAAVAEEKRKAAVAEEQRKAAVAEEKRKAAVAEEAREQREAEEERNKREAEVKRKAAAAEEVRKQREAEAKRKAAAAEEVRKQREAEAKRKAAAAEEVRKQREAEVKRKAEEEARKQREAEARRKAEQEAARDLLIREQAISALNDKTGLINRKVSRNWIEPQGMRAGLQATFLVRFEPDGTVISVQLRKSSTDPIFDRSAENAIHKASPLPVPANPEYYESYKEGILFTFKP